MQLAKQLTLTNYFLPGGCPGLAHQLLPNTPRETADKIDAALWTFTGPPCLLDNIRNAADTIADYARCLLEDF